MTLELETIAVDFVEVDAAVEELEKFLKSAKNPGSIPKVVVPVSLHDCVWVPQYHSPPASPAAGMSSAEESQTWRLLSKISSKPTSTHTRQSTYQRICTWGWDNSAMPKLDRCNFPASWYCLQGRSTVHLISKLTHRSIHSMHLLLRRSSSGYRDYLQTREGRWDHHRRMGVRNM